MTIVFISNTINEVNTDQISRTSHSFPYWIKRFISRTRGREDLVMLMSNRLYKAGPASGSGLLVALRQRPLEGKETQSVHSLRKKVCYWEGRCNRGCKEHINGVSRFVSGVHVNLFIPVRFFITHKC